MKTDQVYCTRGYWCDYPRKDRVAIDKIKDFTEKDKKTIREGTSVCKHNENTGYMSFYDPIVYDDIID